MISGCWLTGAGRGQNTWYWRSTQILKVSRSFYPSIPNIRNQNKVFGKKGFFLSQRNMKKFNYLIAVSID
ncbi:hypothetical protein LSH36_15g08020, partial [Paralvinella palmiformis]